MIKFCSLDPLGVESDLSNPLVKESCLKHLAIPFEDIVYQHFLPALAETISDAKVKIEAIKKEGAAPDLKNTVESLENICQPVLRVAGIYQSLRHAHGTEEMQNLAREFMPQYTEFDNGIKLDSELFHRIKVVYENRNSLDPEQKSLVKKFYLEFIRNGCQLEESAQTRIKEINQRLSILKPMFSENVLKSVNDYQLHLTKEDECVGLPDSVRVSAQAEAERQGKKGWLFTLQMPSLFPFMKYSERRDLRQQIWTAKTQVATVGAFSNFGNAVELAKLCHERAQLLGYDSHAHFQLQERMAEEPKKVWDFLHKLLKATKPKAVAELESLKDYAAKCGGDRELQEWDYYYWARKQKEDLYDLDQEALREYFELDAVIKGVFEHSSRLYDLRFTKSGDYPVYHQDVWVFEVTKNPTNEFIGLLYLDVFPRDTKAAGAWCTRFKGQWIDGNINQRPHVSIVCNFTRPTAGGKSLLTLMEVRTLFHEFGHGLHNLLSQCHYQTLSGTNVYRDFVELPSQIMENWIKEKEGLNIFAKHHETAAPLSDEMIGKISESDNFHAAIAMLRQLKFAYLDMSWFDRFDQSAFAPDSLSGTVQEFEDRVLAETTIFPKVHGANVSCSFEHIFSGGYSAGYYGYKWAEVLDADAFEYFKEQGIFSRKASDAFRENILETGGSDHPLNLYKKFRGREPDPDALLRRYQLI